MQPYYLCEVSSQHKGPYFAVAVEVVECGPGVNKKMVSKVGRLRRRKVLAHLCSDCLEGSVFRLDTPKTGMTVVMVHGHWVLKGPKSEQVSSRKSEPKVE